MSEQEAASVSNLPPGVVGLTSEEVSERIAEGKVNVNADIKTKSVREIILENICTLFNLINVVLAIMVIITGSYKNLTFLITMGCNVVIGTVQSLRSKHVVDKLTLLTTKKAVAVRDGAEVELDLDQIVVDDVIVLKRGDQIPADSVVVAGDAHVNESLLTGESDAVRKTVGSALLSGSFIDSGVLYARVVHVGADNYAAKINNEAKYVKEVNSEILNSLNAIVRFASVLMVPLGVALFFSSIHDTYDPALAGGLGFWEWFVSGGVAWEDVSAALLSTAAALLGMIPQGLVLLTSSVLAIATIRLAQKRVLAKQLYSIEALARVDVLCLDKTGTITSGHMEVAETYAWQGGVAVAHREAGEAMDEVDFALANIAHATSDDANETSAAIGNRYRGDAVEICEPVQTVPFSSAKKWSGATFARGSYVMGAAQFVLPPEAFAAAEPEIARLATDCRVLAVARVPGFTPEGDMTGEAELIGFVTIRDEIRESAPETIRYFCEQDVELKVISGDDPRTVSAIAAQVGVPGAERYVDATTLDTPAKLEAAAARYQVFGRVTPQQKRDLVIALKRQGHTVAMTGDGVNDVLALKEADCSVAMAAGSDAARVVSEIVLVNNDFASMPAVVAEGRRSINNLQRSAALYLNKTVFSMVLAAICIFLPPYPFQPVTMTLINTFCIGFPSFILALEPNHARVEGSFMVNVLKRALPASAAVVVSSLLCIVATRLFGYTDTELSTLCVVSTGVIGCALIWKISYPLTPLRWAVLIICCAGIALGVAFFPDFFSISRLDVPQFVLLAIVSVTGCVVFFKLTSYMEGRSEGRMQRATGFGRGVRVSQGGRAVSSTGSTAGRFATRMAEHFQEKSDRREFRQAQRSASRAVGGGARRSGPGQRSGRRARYTRYSEKGSSTAKGQARAAGTTPAASSSGRAADDAPSGTKVASARGTATDLTGDVPSGRTDVRPSVDPASTQGMPATVKAATAATASAKPSAAATASAKPSIAVAAPAGDGTSGAPPSPRPTVSQKKGSKKKTAKKGASSKGSKGGAADGRAKRVKKTSAGITIEMPAECRGEEDR